MTALSPALDSLASLPGHIGAAVVLAVLASLIVLPSLVVRMRGGR